MSGLFLELDSFVTIKGIWQAIRPNADMLGFISPFTILQIQMFQDIHITQKDSLTSEANLKLRAIFGLINMGYDRSRQSSVKL